MWIGSLSTALTPSPTCADAANNSDTRFDRRRYKAWKPCDIQDVVFGDICHPVELANDLSAKRAARIGDHAEHGVLSEGRRGAGDEGTGSDFRAMAKRITWWQAAEILGITDRQMRRWRQRYEEQDYDGLIDRRRGKPSGRRVPLEQVEKVLQLYREKYFDLNVRHFHEKLRGGTRDRVELHLGEAGVARGRTGEAGPEARGASQAAPAAPAAGDAAASGREPPPVVPGPALV